MIVFCDWQLRDEAYSHLADFIRVAASSKRIVSVFNGTAKRGILIVRPSTPPAVFEVLISSCECFLIAISLSLVKLSSKISTVEDGISPTLRTPSRKASYVDKYSCRYLN